MGKSKTERKKYIIIGAGLSGLVTAYELLKSGEKDFVILESRNCAGGRVLTSHNIDLGATWFQYFHTHFAGLLNDLGIEHFDQYSTGDNLLVHSNTAPAHYFKTDKNGKPSYRVKGGTMMVINALQEKLSDYILLNTQVKEIVAKEYTVLVISDDTVYAAEKVVVTVPPKLAKQLIYKPELPQELTDVMDGVHTWMSNSIKAGITYEKPFWRDKGLSGTVISQISPMLEIYDHSTADGRSFSLMGFVHEGLRNRTKEEREDIIVTYLSSYLGDEAKAYLSYEEKDWSKDRNTSTEKIEPPYGHPSYGDQVFSDSYFNGQLLFSGTETSPVYGGYMEGAVFSGLNAYDFLSGVKG